MPYFSFRHTNPKTGRSNKGRRRAFDAAHLAELLDADGIVGVKDVTAEAEAAPSDRQLDYLRDLGGQTHLASSAAEASDLIDNALGRRAPAGDRERALAGFFRVETTRFASKASIYAKIAAELAGRPDPRDLVKWYVFRVYRDACDRSRPTTIDSPGDVRLAAVVEALAHDDKVLASIRREAAQSGGWRWFGRFTGDDGTERVGASRTTSAYRACLAALRGAALVGELRKVELNRVDPVVRPYYTWHETEPPPAPVSWWRRLLGLG